MIPGTAQAKLLSKGTKALPCNPTARIKHSINRLQERLASALHLTLGESFSYEPPPEFIKRLRSHGFVVVEAKRIDRGYPHPHMLYVARAKGEAVASRPPLEKRIIETTADLA